MKKILSALLPIILIFSFFSACTPQKEKGDLKVVTTVYPLYSWTDEIIKGAEDVSLSLIADNGVELHSYQPTAEDIMEISDCDVFIYIGGESDKWVEDALKSKRNESMTIIKLSDILKDRLLAIGGEKDHDHGFDEHLWLSLKNAKNAVLAISEALSEKAPKSSSLYLENGRKYADELEKLDKDFEEAVNNSAGKPLIFADRFPFLYLLNDYSISYSAAFEGCSTESDATFERVLFLANEVKNHDISILLTVDNGKTELAKTVSEAAERDCEILPLNSLQSVILEERISYLPAMKSNLEIIKKALG